MRKQYKFYCCSLSLLMFNGIVEAQEVQQRGVYVAPSVGYYFFDEDNDDNAEDTLMYGLGVGYQINNNFSIEGNYFELEPEIKETQFDKNGILRYEGEDIDSQYYRIGANFNLDLSSPWSPYATIGYGKLELDPQYFSDEDDNWMMDVGLGVKQRITPSLYVRGGVQALHSWENEDTDYNVNVGLVYLFGAQAAPPPPAPVEEEVIEQPVSDDCDQDTDGDGVPDCRDQCAGTDPRAEVNERGCYVKDQVLESIQLKVLFDFDKAVVKPEYYDEIRQVAQFMQQHPDTRVDIEGHTDSMGTNEYNQQLSQRRADAVREVLIAQFQIPANRIRAIGYGEERPIEPNTTRAGRQANRRVVAVIQTLVEEIKMK
ncbi:MAG: OmpA family protein [Pseudomonadota bacterium]|nr:OmpA family protein [Pseudomonadota bacterium]